MSSSSSAAAGCFKVRSATWSKNAKPIIDCVVGKKVQSRQSASQRRPHHHHHRTTTTTLSLVGNRKKKTMIAAKAASSSFTPPQEEEKTEQSDDQKTFIPAHMRKTVSRITEAQMKENGVELAKASEQVQESIAGFLAFEFLRSRVKNLPTLKVLNVDPPILTAPMFLSAKECEDIERAAFGGEGNAAAPAASSSSGAGPVTRLSSMKKAELVKCCEERGLDASGTVAVLRDRLKEFNAAAGATTATTTTSGGGGGDDGGSAAANTDPFRTSNPDALVNSESKPEAMNQLLKRLNFLFPDCIEEFEPPSARKENKLWGIEVVAEAYKSAENVQPSHAAYEQHEAIERHYQVRANCTFFLNDSDDDGGGGEITFPALPGLSVAPEKGLALITFPATAASLLDPRAATGRNAYDGSNTLNAVDVLIRGATPKILTEEEAAIERKHRHEEEKERARLSAIPRSERRKMRKDEDKPKNSRKKRDTNTTNTNN